MPGVRQKLASDEKSAGKQTKHFQSAGRRVPTPTRVFDAYWHFAAERQRIFRRRLLGRDWGTPDPVLKKYRFTNAYRASDRVSQHLITHVIYDRERPWKDVFLRTLIFKLFNRIETWLELERELVRVDSTTFDVELYGEALTRIRADQGTLYSAAYIMPSARVFGSRQKHINHMRLLQHMLETSLDERLLDCKNAGEAFALLMSYPSIGPFLSYQLLTDLSYSAELDFDESSFVCPGPGALDGLQKCFSDPSDLAPADLIRWTMERQEEEFARRDLPFDDLWGRPLQLIDCQNLFCEISKYAREAFPHVVSRSGRTKIKQGFRPRTEPLTAWYPPKWGLNNHVEGWLRADAT
jgi:hypothetical protein